MHHITRTQALIVAIAISASLVGVGIWASSGFWGLCENEDYTIWLRRLPTNETGPPYVNLTADEIAAHPLVRHALNAYQNPAAYPGARFEGEYLLWRIVTRPSDTSVRDTNDFLAQRYGNGMAPIVITTGDGVFYSWEVWITDPGPPGPC